MIFKPFDPTDIVAGRTSKASSGFFPGDNTFATSSMFESNFSDLTQSIATPSPSYGSSVYDIRRTMFYVDVFPDSTTHANNDPYFSVAYGHVAGSGSFNLDTGSIKANPTQTIYTQYKNLLLGAGNPNGTFDFATGSAAAGLTTSANDIFVINFSSYKMKDKIDEGLFEITLSGSLGSITLRDDSPFLSQTSNVYNLIPGSINDSTSTLPPYPGVGLLYPNDGIVVFNAKKLSDLIGLTNVIGADGCVANYSTGSIDTINLNGVQVATTVNHQVFFWCIQNAAGTMKVRKTEFVPSRHYFVHVKNREYNYSNNPTYVYNGTEDAIHSKGTIRNQDFITDPKTYITTVGLYNDNNELVAVAKLSRPTLKSFDNEVHMRIRLDF